MNYLNSVPFWHKKGYNKGRSGDGRRKDFICEDWQREEKKIVPPQITNNSNHNMASTSPATFTIPKRPLTWLITGCSSGFGLSLARLVQAHGHHLIATSRSPSRTPDLVAEVEAKGGRWLQLNVDDANSAHVIDELEAAGGNNRIDVLVNNAGFSKYACVEQFAEDEVRAQMETLYFGPYRLIRAVVPRMRARRFGVVVNMSSGAGLEGRESMGAYAAAKAALDGKLRLLTFLFDFLGGFVFSFFPNLSRFLMDFSDLG